MEFKRRSPCIYKCRCIVGIPLNKLIDGWFFNSWNRNQCSSCDVLSQSLIAYLNLFHDCVSFELLELIIMNKFSFNECFILSLRSEFLTTPFSTFLTSKSRVYFSEKPFYKNNVCQLWGCGLVKIVFSTPVSSLLHSSLLTSHHHHTS